jgi:hypothetical protein
MPGPLDVEPERNHIRSKLSASEKFNSLLGLRFQVYIILPATLIVGATAIAVEVSAGAGVWWIVLATFIAVASLHLGYLIGAGVNVLASVRTPGEHYEERTMLRLIHVTSFS